MDTVAPVLQFDALQLDVTDRIAPEDDAAILHNLRTYNETVLLGPTDRRGLAILIRNEDGSVEGGLTGYTGRGWLFVSMLFVPERLRGQGIAGRLLEAAEEEAKARGCRGAYIDTINPQARRVYQRAGYEVCGAIENFVPDLHLTWLKKLF